MIQGKVHMSQLSVEIMRPLGSVLAEKQHASPSEVLAYEARQPEPRP